MNITTETMRVITKRRCQMNDTTGRETENLIDQCQQINSVKVAVLFVQLKDGFRCSLRSKVRAIAQKFGGGGHIMASGVNMTGTLKKVKKLILDEIKKQLK